MNTGVSITPSSASERHMLQKVAAKTRVKSLIFKGLKLTLDVSLLSHI